MASRAGACEYVGAGVQPREAARREWVPDAPWVTEALDLEIDGSS